MTSGNQRDDERSECRVLAHSKNTFRPLKELVRLKAKVTFHHRTHIAILSLRSKPSSCPVQTCKSLVRLLLTFQRSRKMQGRIRSYYLVQPKRFGFINDSQNVFDLPSPSVSMQYGAPSEYTTEQ